MLSTENNQTLTFFNGSPYLPVHLVRLGTNSSSIGNELQFLRRRTVVQRATNRSSSADECLKGCGALGNRRWRLFNKASLLERAGVARFAEVRIDQVQIGLLFAQGSIRNLMQTMGCFRTIRFLADRIRGRNIFFLRRVNHHLSLHLCQETKEEKGK